MTRLAWYLDPTVPMQPGERLSRLRESLARKVAWALPRRVLYWAVIRGAVEVEPNSSPDWVKATDILEHFGHD